MSLKIISGKFGSRPLVSPKGIQTRPTTAMARKALFDMCQEMIEEAHVLDLFAGSGAIGLEALSLGASSAVFVEKSRLALDAIGKNIDLLNVEKNCRILAKEALGAVTLLEKEGETFDLIYSDPPYEMPLDPILKALDTSSLLKPEGRLFIESNKQAPDCELKNLILKNSRRFGICFLHQYRLKSINSST